MATGPHFQLDVRSRTVQQTCLKSLVLSKSTTCPGTASVESNHSQFLHKLVAETVSAQCQRGNGNAQENHTTLRSKVQSLSNKKTYPYTQRTLLAIIDQDREANPGQCETDTVPAVTGQNFRGRRV